MTNQVIPEAAVGAAAFALYGAAPWPTEWHEADGARKETYLHYAKLALEAAAPHMLAQRGGSRGDTAPCKWTSGCPQISGHPGQCTGSLHGL